MTNTLHSNSDSLPPLTGPMLWIAALILAAGNFIAVLNMTITNVAVPTIAGNLGISGSQGTWVITSYAVAEAITVPLTGWLSSRFGAVRVFLSSMLLFGIGSLLCGFSTSLSMLVAFRIMQGLCGGPLMPLSQTLLLRIFPKEKEAAAIALWSMTTLVAPVVGPILGGVFCDNYSWSWAFFINAPIGIIGGLLAGGLLYRYESKILKAPIDKIGLALMIIWIAALQIMLDEGKNNDWFASTEICVLAIIAVIGFVAFLIWELTEAQPIVNLRVFRHRGYSASVLTLMVAFGAFFGINVLTPQWLQMNMGYTATWSGMAMAWSGVLAIFLAPIVASLATRMDARILVFIGVAWLGLTTLWRTLSCTDMTFWDVSIPLLFMGIGMPLYFIPLTSLGLASVDESETNDAAGLMNFLRTLAGAFATSLVTTAWEDYAKSNRTELSAITNVKGGIQTLHSMGTPTEVGRGIMDRLVDSQSLMLATNRITLILAGILLLAAIMIWLAPKPTRVADTSAVH